MLICKINCFCLYEIVDFMYIRLLDDCTLHILCCAP